MLVKIFKNEQLLFDIDSDNLTEKQSNDLFEKLRDEKVESIKLEFINNMSFNDVSKFMLDPTNEKVLTQTLVLK